MNRIMIAGTASGTGKTTVSLGIMAALNKRGRKVSPFKVGPDYIDPQFHEFVTGNPSHNLDSWMLDENSLKYLFQRNSKEISVIEGVMGLYDGFGIKKDNGSSAHVSKLLKAPVILVVDGRGMSSSISAMVLGYKKYDEAVDIKGIIINRLSGKAHYDLLKNCIESDLGIPCLGYLPNKLGISLESRHLGLIPAQEVAELRKKVDELADLIEKYVDIDALEAIASSAEVMESAKNPCEKLKGKMKGIKIGYACDKAFSFYYDDNLKLLKEMGIELIPFSPINDDDIPQDVDGLYIGGGFPEVFAKELSDNTKFRSNLKKALDNGMLAYAECGGLMYLTKEIKTLDDEVFEMTGYFDARSEMTGRLQRFGYVEVDVFKMRTKAHEFHRSKVIADSDITTAYDVYKIRNGVINKQWKCGFLKNNTLAGYAHIHFYSNPELLEYMLKRIK
ncbi:cobyrinate a,c-diamide synthase [Abyssisolibacter fermentans]|uniref:cobyrinate a,c-diamide synthase n=1 Tax=Abyssisolibacter fermentans TaxID=1766203 RepID=UPI00083667A6|nr:cobyrinate a,c-diamide synthase [Abyssisolibacter fermentans]